MNIRINLDAIVEFLEYIKLPEQYHIAREYQVYSLLYEMIPILKKMNDNDRMRLKTIAFNNVMLKAIPDQRKFIRDVKGLIKNEAYEGYFLEQGDLNNIIQEKYNELEINTKKDIDSFSEDNQDIAEELQLSMEKALIRSRRQQLKTIPTENVSKSMALLSDIDVNLLDKLDTDDRDNLKIELEELIKLVQRLKRKL